VYHNIGDNPYAYATTVLACLAVVVTVPIYLFYWKGPIIRAKSKFAQVLASDAKANGARGFSTGAQPSVDEKGDIRGDYRNSGERMVDQNV
jgi:hypothetical protein